MTTTTISSSYSTDWNQTWDNFDIQTTTADTTYTVGSSTYGTVGDWTIHYPQGGSVTGDIFDRLLDPHSTLTIEEITALKMFAQELITKQREEAELEAELLEEEKEIADMLDMIG